jgi:2-phosphosulfolactate phosphatase
MDIFTRYCLDGAKKAQGLTVIIDIFRSSNTILALLASGIKKIVVTGSVSKARMLKKDNPSWVLCGERNRVKISGFAYGNSPAEINAAHHRLNRKTVILTTSAGAKGIVSAKHATEIIIGAFANAQAVSHYIQKKKPKIVTLVSIGTNGKVKAMEDTACANFIISLLHGNPLAFSPLKKSILTLKAARDLEKLGYAADLSFCLQKNTSLLVPKVKKKNGLIIITP